MTVAERPPVPDHFTSQEKGKDILVQSFVLQTRLLASGDALNPDNKTLSDVSVDMLQPNPEYTQTLLNRASYRERAETYPAIDTNLSQNEQQQEVERRKHTWAEQFAQSVQTARNFYEKNPEGQKHVTALKKIGIDLLNFDSIEALNVYNRFCKNNDITTFVDAVLEKYTDSAELEKDIAAFQWLGKIFGKQASEVTAELIIARSKIKNETRAKILVSVSNTPAAKDKSSYLNTITPGTKTHEHLTYLWKEKRPTDTVQPITGTRKPPGGDPPKGTDPKSDLKGDEKDKPTKQETQPKGPTPLERRFSIIQGPVNRNHQYFIGKIPTFEDLQLSDADINNLKLVDAHGHGLPFFIDVKDDYSYKTNPKVVPFVWELAEGQPNQNQRFINGEESTDQDSSLVGLAAASAQDSAEQAKLYKILASSIIKVHLNDPDFLTKWLLPGQFPDPTQPASIGVFARYDHEIPEKDKPIKMKPENEQLLAYDDKTVIDKKLFAERWKNRLQELQQALQNDQLESHHLRWIEFLSHSVDVDGLIKTVKSKADTAPLPGEPIRVTPEQNLQAAQFFCNNLRTRIKEAAKKVGEEKGQNIYEDPISKIKIVAANPEAVDKAWFKTTEFIDWAENNKLPLCFWMMPNHATLLLKGPQKGADGKWRVTIYNPNNSSSLKEYQEELNPPEDLDDYKRNEKAKYLQYWDNASGMYIIPPKNNDPASRMTYAEERISPQELEHTLFMNWFNRALPANRGIHPNRQARTQMINNTYDLSLQHDPQLHQKLVEGKIQQFQFDGWNCVAASFYAAALRYAAQDGDSEFKRQGLQQFAQDFGVQILTREELLATT